MGKGDAGMGEMDDDGKGEKGHSQGKWGEDGAVGVGRGLSWPEEESLYERKELFLWGPHKPQGSSQKSHFLKTSEQKAPLESCKKERK